MTVRRPIYLLSDSELFHDDFVKFATVLSERFNYCLRFIANADQTTDRCDGEEGSETCTVDLDNISDFVEENDAAMLIVGLTSNKKIQFFLNKFRELRVPYLFVKQGQIAEFDNVAVPMTYLEEDKEKGPFAGAFGRFFSSKLMVYKPKDYGSKAQQHIDAVCGLFDTLNVVYEVRQGRKDSTKIELEAVNEAENSNVGLVIVSASREYGLDDLILGPKERKIIMSASVPVMLINPRGDLYALCD